MMRSLICCAGLTVACGASSASAQLRVAAWNLSNYDGDDRVSAIQTAVYGVVPAGPLMGDRMRPDIILLQEFQTATALATFVSVLNTAAGSPGDWAAAPFVNGADDESCMVFRTSKVQLLNNETISIGSSVLPNPPRNTYRYDVRPVGYTGVLATVGMYSSHMKAQDSGSDDDLRRLTEVQRIRDNAAGIDTAGTGTGMPPGYLFLFGGDTNIQRAGSTEYIEFVGSQADNSGRFFDPIKSGVNGGSSSTNGNWNSNTNYRFIHTQDPSGAGGMDDRHDQILVSGEFIDGPGFEYIGNSNVQFSQTTWNDPNHSYRCWGNDGDSCCNSPLDTVNNGMVGNTIAAALVACATPAGGHLPVYLDLKVPSEITSDLVIDFGTVVQGSVVTRPLSVSNAGNVALWTVAGIANLSYTLAASAGFSAPGGAFGDVAGGTVNSHTISMNTATLGMRSGTITIASDAPDQPSRTVTLMGNVVTNNLAPTANAGPDFVINDTDGSGAEPVTLDASASTDTDGIITDYAWREGASLIASGPTSTLTASLAVGSHSISLTVTDDDGAQGSDSVVIRINGRPIADAGPDVTRDDTDNSGFEIVTLDASGSTDDGAIDRFEWREGTVLLASTPVADVSFTLGVHAMVLTVTDDDGLTHTDTLTVTIEPPVCPSDWDADGDVDSDDVVAFFGEWETGDGDVDLDGDTDSDDIGVFFGAWEGGC